MAGPILTHLLPDPAAIDAAGRLSVGGCDLVELADRFGTPLFVYDEAHLRTRCREAVAAFGDGVAYASKAFLCGAMARLAHEEGMYLDVATGGALVVARPAGVPGGKPPVIRCVRWDLVMPILRSKNFTRVPICLVSASVLQMLGFIFRRWLLHWFGRKTFLRMRLRS